VGFKEVRNRVIACLIAGLYLFENRDVVEGKNLLQTGEVLPEELIGLLNRCRGNQFEQRLHHFDQSVTVYIFKPTHAAGRWYIKLYFADESTVFISVHT
jgi:hypothetical protein